MTLPRRVPAPPPHNHEPSTRVPHIERVTLTRVEFTRGTGCCELSTFRIVTAYYDDEGNLLWEDDPCRTRST